MNWPPDLTALKLDLISRGEQTGDLDTDDDRLRQVLDAAVAFVRRVRGDDLPLLTPDQEADLVLGTVRLAGRWHTRRRSPDGLIEMGELGTSRVPSFDPDIERLLGIGRYRKAVFA